MDVTHDNRQIQQLRLELEFAGTNPCHIQQIINDACLAGDGVTDGRNGFTGLFRAAHRRQATQDFGIQLNQVERVFQLVRHDGEKLVLHVAGNLVFRQLLALLFMQSFMAGQITGDLT